MKPGSDERLQQAEEAWEEEVGRGTDSGWMRSLTLRGTADPNVVYQLVFFESEEKARANEQSPEHQKALEGLMALADGEPEYVDLIPVRESSR
jgi:hypothetical protein